MEQDRSRRFPWRIYAGSLVVIIFIGLFPIIPGLLAQLVADSHGCQLNEGGGGPCYILGHDWGDTLADMLVFGWFLMITMPLGVALALGWLVVLFVHLIVARRESEAG